MALIGHWPLNGDTRNFAGTIQVAGSITYSNEGKIGKCMDSGSLTLPPGTMNNRSQSIAFWYYNKATSSATTTTSQFMGGSSPRDYSLFTYPNNDDLHWDFRNLNNSTIFGGVLSGVLKNLEWTHVTIINDNLHFKIYINGVLEQSKIVTSWDNDFSEKSFPLLINNPEGRYNDIRIYDHALTEMEIQEIARAKILHYTFDDMQEPTTNLLNNNNEFVKTSSYAMKDYTFRGPMVDDETYTISLKGQLGVGKTYFGIYNSGGVVTLASLTPSDQGPDGIYRKTFKWRIGSSSNTYLRVYHMSYSTTVDSVIEWVQLEKKDHATEFTPNSRTAKVNDYSGFFNHSEPLPEITTFRGETMTTPQWIPEAKIGTGAYKLNGNNHFLIHKYNASNDASLSLWFKSDLPTSTGQIVIGSPSSLSFGIINNTIIGMATTSAPVGLLSGSSYTVGQWNHIVITRDSSNVMSYYVNGIKISNGSNNSWSWNNDPYGTIGRRTLGSSESAYYANGEIDDVRVYATTLSEKDIKDLYETRAEIEESGVLYARDFNENFLNRCPSFNNWSLSGNAYVENDILVIPDTASSAVSPYIYIGPDSNWYWKAEYYATEQSLRVETQPNAGYLEGSSYYDFQYNPTPNTAGYTGNGNAGSYPIKQWTSKSWSYVGGNDVVYMKININGSSAYAQNSGFKVKNPMLTTHSTDVNYAPYSNALINAAESLDQDKNYGIKENGTANYNDFSTVGITDGLVGYWPLDNNSKDYSGSNYDLTDPNTNVSITDGAIFTGTSSQKLFVENFPKYTSNFTWSVDLINTVQNTSQQFVVSLGRDCCDVFGMNIVVINGIINVYIGTGTVINTNISCVNLLRNVIVSVDSANVRVYVDGIQTNIIDIPVFDYGTSTALVVGKMSYTYTSDTTYFPFNGIIKNFKIFNRALTPEEVAIEYNTMFNNEVQIHESGVLYAKDIIQY